jgi:hypothetical protein
MFALPGTFNSRETLPSTMSQTTFRLLGRPEGGPDDEAVPPLRTVT